MDTTSSSLNLDLPGFRFHPTEEELLDFYLRRAAHGKKLSLDIIGTLDLYKHEPWDLPGLAKLGEKEWYFFVPRERKNGGRRPNRTTERGFWKATGSDRPVRSINDPKRQLGLKKTLVYYQGRAPRGTKTDWVMNEYRLPTTSTSPKEDMVLCKIYRKAMSQKELEQRASVDAFPMQLPAPDSAFGTATMASPSPDYCEDLVMGMVEEIDGGEEMKKESAAGGGGLLRWNALPQLEVPVAKQGMRWVLDETCLWSPWMMEFWSPCGSIWNGELL